MCWLCGYRARPVLKVSLHHGPQSTKTGEDFWPFGAHWCSSTLRLINAPIMHNTGGPGTDKYSSPAGAGAAATATTENMAKFKAFR